MISGMARLAWLGAATVVFAWAVVSALSEGVGSAYWVVAILAVLAFLAFLGASHYGVIAGLFPVGAFVVFAWAVVSGVSEGLASLYWGVAFLAFLAFLVAWHVGAVYMAIFLLGDLIEAYDRHLNLVWLGAIIVFFGLMLIYLVSGSPASA